MPFQPSLMFAFKAETCQTKEPFRVGYGPYPHTLDQAGKAFQKKTLKLIMKICKART
jgi:hypothetical protein